MNKNYYVYILTNKNNTTLYIGVTNNLERRMQKHKSKIIKGFTYKYNLNKLVYYEYYTDINEAIAREKQLKGIKRERKDELINIENQSWNDLSADWF